MLGSLRKVWGKTLFEEVVSPVSQLSGPGVADPIKGRAEPIFLQIPMTLPRDDLCHLDPSPSIPVVYSIIVHHS